MTVVWARSGECAVAYFDDIAAEAQWHSECGAPGRPAINRTSTCFLQGQVDHYYGRAECPYAVGTTAALNWHAGWNDDIQAAEARAEKFREAMREVPGKF